MIMVGMWQWSYGLKKTPFRNPRVEIRGFLRISAHSAGWRNCGLFRGIVPRTRSAYSADMVPTAETPHAHAHACCLRIFPQDIVGETSSRTTKVIYMPFCTSLLCICACAVWDWCDLCGFTGYSMDFHGNPHNPYLRTLQQVRGGIGSATPRSAPA